ncbi:hypothetical protein K7402_28510 [Pseudomonas fluorescens group sp.]|uniref:Uncharacterized protein n=2 Tax=Pseudomonas fluorescens TaxID=294 RepID=C3K1N7_PSEFS|nr:MULTISPECIES: hypothetical protein [Pseudomonas fluorescens group]MBZ6459144.1 hypothetical protein [Pseudomonas fluorescens group sp.]MBZ6464392.1 hypothetical protein [Pseudomonas fluorescens group sp.]MBZ6471343.1 hypothetical protein [Pseudomonas fluorescens group sp.]WQD71355.1 hypothetical protein U0037_25435 [Pseudomonas marginalis]CAI2799227.1 Uncharacterized protein PFLU_5080 [Pseudomonas fluorescens SBW25]
MDFERSIETEELELEIAGFDVTCLVWDQDDVEAAVRSLVLFPQFNEHFRDAFDLINTATSFWLEEGSYAPCTESVTKTLYRLRDPISEHASYAEAGSLPSVIRRFLGVSHSAADSQLAATFALVMGTQAVETLANWLFDLELTTYDIDADLIEQLKHDSPRQYLALIEKERDRSSGNEIRAREDFATLLGEANQALLMASLYRQVEQMDVFKKGFNTSSLMHRILDNAFSTKATRRGQEAGSGNRDPSSKIQIDTMDRRAKIKAAAEQTINGRKIEMRSLTDAELTNILSKREGLGTKKTIREHLTALGLRPLK